jgi:hypothetical protein
MSNKQKYNKNVIMGQEFQNWYSFFLNFTSVSKKKTHKTFSHDYFLAKKGSNLENGLQKCQDVRFCVQTSVILCKIFKIFHF